MKLPLLLFGLVFFQSYLFSQCMLIETSIKEMTEKSKEIVELEILDNFSTWDDQHNLIYTIHKAKVYGSFKKLKSPYIYIATKGGIVGDTMLEVNPETKLIKGQKGIMFLKDISFFKSLSLKFPIYTPSFNAQSFFIYDEHSNSVSGVFKNYVLDKRELDREIETFTDMPFNKLKDLKLEIKDNTSYSRMITSFSPSTVTGGTFTSLTINGTGFGTTKGFVRFTNSSAGPGGYTRVFQQDITSWSDNQIVVKVPTFAGTGKIWVETSTGTDYLSSTNLMVRYSETTLAPSGDSVQYQTRLSSKTSNLGKFTFTYNTTFFNTAGAAAAFKRALDNWICKTKINWNVSNTTSPNTAVSSSDNTSLIFFQAISGDPIAQAHNWYISCSPLQTWYCFDIDIRFDTDVSWSYSTGTPLSNQMDFESVALHELGHAHQLGHIIDNTKVMNRFILTGTTLRVLSDDEIEGASDVYSRSLTQGNCTGTNYNPMTNAIIVTSSNDSGNGTLRQAISDVANNENIMVCGELLNSTIILTSAELTINKNINILGQSQSTFAISGNNERRIFNIQAGKTLTLQNMKLTNATSSTNGGAIFNNGILNLNNVTFQNNFQNGVSKAFSSPNGTSVNLESSVIINN